MDFRFLEATREPSPLMRVQGHGSPMSEEPGALQWHLPVDKNEKAVPATQTIIPPYPLCECNAHVVTAALSSVAIAAYIETMTKS